MTDELIFFTNPMSRGRIARWMLEEAGCDYRTEILAFGTDMKAPGYLAVNPMGKVPAILHRGTGSGADSARAKAQPARRFSIMMRNC